MNIIEKIEKEQLEKLSSGKQIPDFNPGDTIKVDVKVVEGTRERIQAFEGVCIARGGKGINESFTVRKISYGEGVERVFPLFSPKISSITLVRKGKVRRAKLYYLRDRRGKAARIVEKIEVKKKTNEKKDVASVSKDKVAETSSKKEVENKSEVKSEDKKVKSGIVGQRRKSKVKKNKILRKIEGGKLPLKRKSF